MKTPYEICTRYLSLQQEMKTLVNKKRKDCDRELLSLKNQHLNIDKDTVSVKEYMDILREHDNECASLHFMVSFIQNQTMSICRILQEHGLVEIDQANYLLTPLGKMASSIAEVHGPIMSQFILENEYFKAFDVKDLVGILSCFTDVKIADDERKYIPPTNTLRDLAKLYRKYEDIEESQDVRTGIHYVNAIQFDMYELSMKWTDCADEQQCKEFIQVELGAKGISIGDFNKAMMKIATIAKELMKVAEETGQIEFLHKLSKVEGLVFKYVTTAQSLYL
jgi:hypothetical protein